MGNWASFELFSSRRDYRGQAIYFRTAREGEPVPEGLSDRSQAIYCLVSVQKREPSGRARYDWVR